MARNSTHVRVSTKAFADLERRAKAEGRTMSSVIDHMLGVSASPPAVVPERTGQVERAVKTASTVNSARAVKDESPVKRERTSPARCPRCGCSVVMHQAGEQGNRCQLHVTCRWTP